ncbi:hypothetical protein Q2T41_04645 [Maribacter confluentis]|uniref:Peptidase S74 domain-containing protein n=1 Tax=Maribacter confluentis TaxID=1656093 RepID=A0ABT8RMD0_9FLAO|nr:hypothetical protein [Maribacter confluentis]MDO1511950.1 hypothetical protein [Maribacter confluentis]
MKAIIFFFLIALFTVPTVTGQIKIGDNPQNIDPASVLELESSSKVLVITRVTTAEMDAILPQRGGIVYNTDAECIYYYDGVAWINLCDAVDFNITNDPIINNRSTIAITQSNAGYNLEVAKNSILGNNIVDGGIGAVDIADNSITQDKLAENSVGSSEIRENAVGSVELKERSIQAVNIAEHTPGHILITDENGIVVWQEADALKGAIADEFTITGDGTLENRLELSEGIQLNISNNTTLIADHIVADEDTDDTNELVDLSFDKLTNTLSISKSATPNGGSVNLEAVIGSDDQELTLNNNILTLEAGGAPIDLTTYLDNTDEQILSINGNVLSITGGNDITLPAGAAEVDGDVRNELQDLAFDNATNTLTLTTPGTPGNQVNLSGLAGGGITSLNNGFILVGNATNEPTEVSIDGDATMNNIGELTIKDGVITPANIEPLTPTPTANQMLITNTAGVVTWAPAGSGTNALDNGHIFIGNDLNTATPTVVQGAASLSNNGTLTLLNKVVEGANIADETIVLENLNQNGATNGQIIKWDQSLNAGAGAWTVANDLTDGTGIPTLASGTMLIGNNANLPNEVTISGDATISNTGVLSISPLAISDTELAENSVTTEKLAPGTAADQLLQFDGTDWVLIDESDISATVTEVDGIVGNEISAVADGTLLLTGAGTAADPLTLDVAPLGIGTAEIAANSVTPAKIAEGTAADQLLQFDGTDWVLIDESDISATVTEVDGIVGNEISAVADGTLLLTGAGTAADPLTLDVAPLGIGTAEIAANSVTPAKIAEGTAANQLLQFDGTNWVLIDESDISATVTEVDGIVGNEISAVADGTLLLTGAGTAADPLTLDVAPLGIGTAEIAANSVTPAKIADGTAADQLLQFDGTDWVLIDESDISATVTEVDGIVGNEISAVADGTLLLTGAGTAADPLTLDVAPLGIGTAEIATNSVTPAKIAEGTNGQVLTTNAAGDVVWAPPSGNNLSTTNLTQTAGQDRTYDLNENDLTFDITNSTLSFAGINSYVGIGNITPQDKLDVDGQIRARNGFGASNGTSGQPSLGFYNDSDTGIYRGNLVDHLRFSTNGDEAMVIDPGQNVGIGTATPSARLHVVGDSRFDGNVLVNGTVTTVPDYVFQKYFLGNSNLKPDYDMPSLLEVENFIKANHHLPNVPSYLDIEKQGGIIINKTTLTNLEKIEELFLHTIEQEKKIKALETTNKDMANQIELLKAQMEEIKQLMLEKTKE